MADITKKSDFILFFAESFKRWGQKSPKYFRVWKTINGVLLGIGTAGVSLSQLTALFPGIWPKVIFAIIGFCGGYGVAMNTLPVKQPTTEIMPFTEKKQIQQEEKTVQTETKQ